MELANKHNNFNKIVKQCSGGLPVSLREWKNWVWEILVKSGWVYEYITLLTEIVKNGRRGVDLLVGIDLSELRPPDCLGNHCSWKLYSLSS